MSKGTFDKELRRAVEKLDISGEAREKILALAPENYLGLAPRLVEIALQRWNNFKENYKNERGVLVAKKYKAIIYDMDNTLVARDKFTFDLLKKVAQDLSGKFFFRFLMMIQ